MIDALIKISGSLFVGGLGLIMIIFSILITTVAVKEILNYFDNKKR
jgi:hypothetical protein